MSSAEYVRKFRAGKSVLTVYLDKKEDADIIAYFDKMDGKKSEEAKKLLRQGIKNI